MILGVVAMFASTPVFANCVTSRHLEAGIRADFSDGTYQIHRRIDPDLVHVEFGDGSGKFAHQTMIHGIHLVSYAVTVSKRTRILSRKAFFGPTPPRDLPKAALGVQYSSPWFVFYEGSLTQEKMTLTFEKNSTQQSFDCTYEIWPFETEYQLEDGTIERVGSNYFPTLGISIFSSFQKDVDPVHVYQMISLTSAH